MTTIKLKALNYLLILLYANWLVSYDTIAPGVLYKNIITLNPVQSIHVLIADPSKVNIKIGITKDKCASAEKTTEISKKHNAIAAINGGFFDFGCKNKFEDAVIKIFDCLGYSKYKAYPIHTLKNYNQLYSMSHIFTGVVGWSNDNSRPSFGIIKTHINLIINGQNYLVNELNKPHPNNPTLYSDSYDEKSPSYDKHVDEIVIEYNCIKEICLASRGQTKIPKNGWVYALPKKCQDLMVSLKKGDPVSVIISHEQKLDSSLTIADCNWLSKDHLLASTPLLIYNDQIVPYLSHFSSTFYTKKHPRSSIGLLKDGNWVFIVVDGRQNHSEGFTILEFANFMKELGCTDALNLDGGGSSTMIVQDKMVNSPSGREYSLFRGERSISNALLITPKK